MNTLLITEVFPPMTGGSGRWFWELYRRMPRENVLIAAGQHPNQEEFDRSHDMRIVRLPLALKSWGLCKWNEIREFWRPLRSLNQLIRGKRIGVVHCGKCLPEGLLALVLKWWTGAPFICYVHGEEMKAVTHSRELTWLTRRVIRGAEFLIANSHNTASILRQEWDVPTSRVHVLHPGVDTQKFIPADRDLSVRSRLGWSDRPVVLTVGRLQKRKGHDVMIAALDMIRRTVPDILYSIVGDGEERGNLEEQVRQAALQDHVQFLGERSDDDLISCYQQCDLFVLPNRQVGLDIEGFGMVLVEAQACGKPVVAGASGGTAETMKVPETGRMVSCDNPNELAATVISLVKDPRPLARMGRAARAFAVDQFDWPVLVDQAAQLFCQVRRDSPVGCSYTEPIVAGC